MCSGNRSGGWAGSLRRSQPGIHALECSQGLLRNDRRAAPVCMTRTLNTWTRDLSRGLNFPRQAQASGPFVERFHIHTDDGRGYGPSTECRRRGFFPTMRPTGRPGLEQEACVEPQPGWDSVLGINVEEMTPTRVVAYIDIDERHQQGYGIVHGGVWASVVESVGSHGAAMAAYRDQRRHGRRRRGELDRLLPAPPHGAGEGDRHADPGRPAPNRSGWSRSSGRATGRWSPEASSRVQNLAAQPERRELS